MLDPIKEKDENEEEINESEPIEEEAKLDEKALSDDSIDFEQLREAINKEEPVIFDALEAVYGFHTRDDVHRCRFYDFRTGGCWKGGRCREHHLPEPQDGIFRDKKDIHFYDVCSPPRPKRKLFYPIKIISFIGMNRFTAYYLDQNTFYGGKSLEDLRDQINSRTYNRLKELPAVGELVTAKINGEFYRARILEEIDEFMTFPVYLVDEGTFNKRVSYENIFEYCIHLKEFPFFAVEFTIADFEPLEENPHDIEAKNWILSTQDNAGPLSALIQ
jgi:hypothetical protein